jgi:predicted nucleic acid-binding protein
MMGQKVINDAAHQAYLSADNGDDTIIIPAVVLMEVLYLFEKNRIEIGLLQTEYLRESQNYRFEPLSFEILETASGIDDIPEPHDRLIAATARHLDLPLITNDPVIINSKFVQILE